MLSTQEIKTLRDDLRRAHELVRNAFMATRAAGISNIARDLRHVGNSIEDAIAELCELLEKQSPICGGGND
jgi:predicted metal-dependent hydrolase